MTVFGGLKLGSLIALAAISLSPAAWAGLQHEATQRAVYNHVFPAVENFLQATVALDQAAQSDCTPDGMKPAYHEAFDAWMGLQHLNIGPIEDGGRLLTVAFWPDKKGAIPRALTRTLQVQDVQVLHEAKFLEMSIAVRGFFALEYMLFDAQFSKYDPQDYSCHMVQTIAHDLFKTALDIDAGWREGGFAELLLTAGVDGNERYFTEAEGAQTLYTMLTTGLENTAIARLGRPLGSFNKPRPRLAEAYRSERSLRNVKLSVEAAKDLAKALAPEPPEASLAAFEDVLSMIDALGDPTFKTVADPSGRLKIEIIQQRIEALIGYLANDIGVPLKVSAGFNASDGD